MQWWRDALLRQPKPLQFHYDYNTLSSLFSLVTYRGVFREGGFRLPPPPFGGEKNCTSIQCIENMLKFERC